MKEQKEKLWNAGFIELILLSFLTSFSFSCVHPLVSSFATDFGADPTAAGTAVGIFSISAMVIRPFSGFFADNINRKKLLFITTLAFGLAQALYFLSSSVVLLIVLRVIHGIAFGVNSTVNMALAVEYIPKSRMGEGLGFYGVGQVIAQISAPSCGVWLKDAIGFTWLFISAGLMVLVGAFIFLFCFHYEYAPVPKTIQSEHENPIRKILHSLIAKECIFYALITSLFSMSNGIVNSFLVLLGDEKQILNISLFFTVNALVLFLLRISVGKLLDKMKLILIVTFSLLTSGLSMVMVGFSGALWVILAAAAIKAIGHVGGQITLQSACVHKVDKSRVGVATSTYYIGADLGNGFGPIWGGKVVEAAGYSAAFYAMGGVFAVGAVIFVIYELVTSRRLKSAPSVV